jgi:methylthioribose-1-phosphate isomerase
VAPAGVAVRNPAFDVTPAELIAAIVTEVGVLRPPYSGSIARALALP